MRTAANLVKVLDVLPRRHSLRAKGDHLSCQPFFVIGSGRNGSTMFSGMLNSHSQVLLPTEQWRFPNMILKYKIYNFLPWKELVSLILGEIAASNSALHWNINFNDALTTLQYLPKEEQSLQRILDEIYLTYGRQHEESFQVWGEKSPKNMPFTKEIFQVYPQSKYIFLVRDGRDVARSWLIKNKSEDIRWIAESWNESIQMFDWLRKKAGKKGLLKVHYENLVSQPEETLTKVMDFLGLPFEEEMLSFQGYANKIENKQVLQHFEKLKQPANPSSIGKWKEHFDEDQIAFLEGIIGPNLQRFKYV